MAAVANHPNRSKQNRAAGGTPTPAEIQRARVDADLTQEQAGALIFTGWRTWQNWEGGINKMPAGAWELFNVKLRARELIKRGELEPALLRSIGLYLPPEK